MRANDSFLYVETQKSRASFHMVLIEPSSADTPELGEQTRGWRLETGARGGVEAWAWGTRLTFQPAGTWDLVCMCLWSRIWSGNLTRSGLPRALSRMLQWACRPVPFSGV